MSLVQVLYARQRTSSFRKQVSVIIQARVSRRNQSRLSMTMTDHLTRTRPMLIMTEHSSRNGERAAAAIAAADTRLENNWLVPVGRGTVLAHRGAHSGAHTSCREAAPNSEQRGATASAFKPQPPLSRWASLGARGDRRLFFHLLLLPHLTFILGVLRFVVRTRSLPPPPPLSVSLFFFSLLCIAPSLLSLALCASSYLPTRRISDLLQFLAPRCTWDFTAFFSFLCLVILSTIDISFSTILFFVSLRDIVFLSVPFAFCFSGALHSRDAFARNFTLNLMYSELPAFLLRVILYTCTC